MKIIKSSLDQAKRVSAPTYIYQSAKLRFISCISSLLVLTMIASYY